MVLRSEILLHQFLWCQNCDHIYQVYYFQEYIYDVTLLHKVLSCSTYTNRDKRQRYQYNRCVFNTEAPGY